MPILRRHVWTLTTLGLPFSQSAANAAATPSVPDTFPSHPPALAREMVAVSHGNVKRVRELVAARPTLANASWDWGFGDWETALGAASHVGNHEIAGILIANGAPPTLFSAAMLGQLEVVKALVAANPGAQRIGGPHSISLLAHAKSGGKAAAEVLQYLESLGDAGAATAVPLTEAEMNSLTGTYVFGTGPNDRIEITLKGSLMFTRKGADARGLFHLGERAFHPVGAKPVRIRFTGERAKMALTVHDPEPVLRAERQ